jgi:hypothetical protein
LEKFPFLIIGEEHACFLKEFPNARDPMCEALFRRNGSSKNGSSLLKSNPFGKGTYFQRSVFPVNSPAWIDIITTHEAAFFVPLKKKYFKLSGFFVPEENCGRGFFRDDWHKFPSPVPLGRSD